MAEPIVIDVRHTESGGDAAAATIDKVADSVDRATDELTKYERAADKASGAAGGLAGESGKLGKATDDTSKKTDGLTVSTKANAAQLVSAAGAAVQMAGAVGDLASTMYDAAKAGASANTVLSQWEGLGRTAEDMRALKAATAGIITETELQQWDLWTQGLGITNRELQDASRFVIATADKMGQLENASALMEGVIKGSAEAVEALGLRLDMSSAAFAGLSEAQKKTAVLQAVATEGALLGADALESQSIKLARLETGVGDFRSEMEQYIADIVTSDEVQSALNDGLGALKEAFGDNKDSIVLMVDAAVNLVEMMTALAPLIELVGITAKVTTLPLIAMSETLGMVGDAASEVIEFVTDLTSKNTSLTRSAMLAADAMDDLAKRTAKGAADAGRELQGVIDLEYDIEDATGFYADLMEQSGKDIGSALYKGLGESKATDEIERQLEKVNAFTEAGFLTERQALESRTLLYDALDEVDRREEARTAKRSSSADAGPGEFWGAASTQVADELSSALVLWEDFTEASNDLADRRAKALEDESQRRGAVMRAMVSDAIGGTKAIFANTVKYLGDTERARKEDAKLQSQIANGAMDAGMKIAEAGGASTAVLGWLGVLRNTALLAESIATGDIPGAIAAGSAIAAWGAAKIAGESASGGRASTSTGSATAASGSTGQTALSSPVNADTERQAASTTNIYVTSLDPATAAEYIGESLSKAVEWGTGAGVPSSAITDSQRRGW